MSDSDSAPSERKIAALLLIAVVAGAIGIYSYGQEHPETMGAFNSIFKSISLPTGLAIFSGAKPQMISIDAELMFDVPTSTNAEIRNPAESVSVSFQNPNNTFTIDRFSWQYPSKTEIVLKNYTGSFELSNPLSFSGAAKSIEVNSAAIPYSGRDIDVSASSFGFDSVMFKNLENLDIELKNISGIIKAKDPKNSAVYSVSNSQLSVAEFDGDIEYYGGKIILRGSGKMNAELLGIKSK